MREDEDVGGGDAPLDIGSAVEEAAGRSLLDRIKERRDERVVDERLTLDIPTWGGELRARYQVVPRPELERIIKSLRSRSLAAGKTVDGSRADVDFLLRACCEIIAYDLESGNEEVVSDGYNARLAGLLGRDDDARGIILHLFNNNGIALAAHSMKVARWMEDTSKEPEDDSGAGA